MFLATRCSFLFLPGAFRIVDSRTSESFGDAMVLLESSILRIRLTRDRLQLLLEFQPLDGKEEEWFSPALLRGWLEGNRGESEVLDDEWAQFLSRALPEVESRLRDPDQRERVLDGLRRQARQRANELFG